MTFAVFVSLRDSEPWHIRIGCDGLYSVLSDTIGSIRAARRAGT